MAGGGAAAAESHLASRVQQHTFLLRFCTLHGLCEPAAWPHEAATLLAHGEKLASALALRRLQNGAAAEHSHLLIGVFERVVRSLPDAAAAAAGAPTGGAAQEAFFGGLLLPGRWEAFLEQLALEAHAPLSGFAPARSAVSGARGAAPSVADPLPRLAFLCAAAVVPLAAARTYRDEAVSLLGAAGAGAAEAAAASAISANVLRWTSESNVSDHPLLRLSQASCAALQAVGAALGTLPPALTQEAARLIENLARLHEERLIGRLELVQLAPDTAARVDAFEEAKQQAAEALLGLGGPLGGAVPYAVALAEKMHDWKTLALLCMARRDGAPVMPCVPSDLLNGRRAISPHELRHELLTRYSSGAPPPPPLYEGEGGAAGATHKFVEALCSAHYEHGSAACRELLLLPQTYPALKPTLRSFLEAYPRLYWLHLVDEAAHASAHHDDAPLHDAAAALYGWGLLSAHGVTPIERKAFLSVGKLCHRAALLPEDPAALRAHADAVVKAKRAGRPPPPPPKPPDQLPKVRNVEVSLDGEQRSGVVDVGLNDVADEQYALRVQEKLGLGEARPTEEIITTLLRHAEDGGTLGQDVALGGRRLDPATCCELALDVAHKTAWRYGDGTEGSDSAEARRSRLHEIFWAALQMHQGVDRWRDLAVRKRNHGLNDTEILNVLQPLPLFRLLIHQAHRSMAKPGGAEHGWLHSSALIGGSLLSSLVERAVGPGHPETVLLQELLDEAHRKAVEAARGAAAADEVAVSGMGGGAATAEEVAASGMGGANEDFVVVDRDVDMEGSPGP